ncbi:MAG: glycoside hydrolase family 6 protein [Cyanobacteria bacterium P01_H01_bin.74]
MRLLFFSGLTAFVLLAFWVYTPRPVDQTLVLIPRWTRSAELYGQPHAVWLSQDARVGANLKKLKKVLAQARRENKTPELVIYCIPLRDLGQSSEGGFATYSQYFQENTLIAEKIAEFVKKTGIKPVVYLEPDALPLAIQYKTDTQFSAKSQAIYTQRTQAIETLVRQYKAAGALVFLDAGHSGWFDFGLPTLSTLAKALNDSGVHHADGIASNISNRQPVGEIALKPNTERHYLKNLLPLLNNSANKSARKMPLQVRVDTSRNGGQTRGRHYYLHPDGFLIDNEIKTGRLVGFWFEKPVDFLGFQPTAFFINGRQQCCDIIFSPFFGDKKQLSRLTGKEKYQYNPKTRILSAPPWLDAVGDVKLGPVPTDTPPESVSAVISAYRYIKPPDDCDGALNCPPGQSKSIINQKTEMKQRRKNWQLPEGF